MYCLKCGTQLPDGAIFCLKCGAKVGDVSSSTSSSSSSSSAPQQQQIVAAPNATSLKCPNCGAPISPKFGEMIITCEYCGSSVSLGNAGWTSIQKQTMLPLKIATAEQVDSIITPLMDKGFLHRHLHEDSKQEEMSLSYVPYWLVSVSARTSIVAENVAAQVGQTATTAALMGVILGGMAGGGGFGGGRRRALSLGADLSSLMSLVGRGTGVIPSSMVMMFGMGMGYGGGGGIRKAEQMDENYNFPVVALKALTAYQPRDYQFSLGERTLFDISHLPKSVKVLNGDISEDVAKNQAKTLVDQLQSEKAHAKYHMIQQINSQIDVGDVELLHAPIWFARYDHKGNKIALVIDANSGRLINSMGL